MNINYFTDRENILHQLLIILLVLLFTGYTKAVRGEEKIGNVVFARGAVSAQQHGGQVRILGKDAAIYRDDTITTGPKSFGVISFTDGTRLSARPNSVLIIDDYTDTKGSESATMRLLQGGLRAISGLISKSNPEAFKINTSAATIGIHGTEFDARLCENDCTEEAAGLPGKKSAIDTSVVGRVVIIKGEVTAKAGSKDPRKLSRGAPLYETDEITTDENAFVVIAFRDQGSITIKSNSRMKIEEYKFNQAEPADDSSVFRLVKGGMRALTGLIGKRNPDNYKVDTAVATIGIRGTGFDLLWLGPCTTSIDCGLVASVWEGVITSNNESGTEAIGLNKVARITAVDLNPEFITTPPVFTVPRPDTVDVDFENLFGAESRSGAEPGLYVACYEGHCAMFQEDQRLDLGAGEAGYASMEDKELFRLARIESFQQHDPYLNTINEEFDSLYELLDGSVVKETEFECVVQ